MLGVGQHTQRPPGDICAIDFAIVKPHIRYRARPIDRSELGEVCTSSDMPGASPAVKLRALLLSHRRRRHTIAHKLGKHCAGLQPGIMSIRAVLKHITRDGQVMNRPKRSRRVVFQRHTLVETLLA